MPKLKVVHKQREIGYLELPEWVLDTKAPQVPGFEGNDTGLALVVELRDRPVAGVVYRTDGETLDITEPTRLQFSAQEVGLSPEDAAVYERALFSASRSQRGSEEINVSWSAIGSRRSEKDFRRRMPAGGRFSLELHDEEIRLDASLRWESWEQIGAPFFGEGSFCACPLG